MKNNRKTLKKGGANNIPNFEDLVNLFAKVKERPVGDALDPDQPIPDFKTRFEELQRRFEELQKRFKEIHKRVVGKCKRNNNNNPNRVNTKKLKI